MARTIKTIVAMAILMTSITAQAASGSDMQFVSGSGNWTIYSGSGWLNDAPDYITATEGSGVFLDTSGAGNQAHYQELTRIDDNTLTEGVSFVFTGASLAGDQVKTLSSQSSNLSLYRSATRQGQLVLNRWASLSDFVFDLDTHTLSATVTGTDFLTGVTTQYGFTELLSAPGLSSSTLNGVTTFSTTGPFTLHTASANTLMSILGIPLDASPTQQAFIGDVWRRTDWGTFSGQVTLSAVPEPSSLWLGAWAGLVVLGAARARRQKSA